MINLCGELVCAGLPRSKHGVVAPNLGDDSGRYEDHGTTENPAQPSRNPLTYEPVGCVELAMTHRSASRCVFARHPTCWDEPDLGPRPFQGAILMPPAFRCR